VDTAAAIGAYKKLHYRKQIARRRQGQDGSAAAINNYVYSKLNIVLHNLPRYRRYVPKEHIAVMYAHVVGRS